MTTTAKSPDPSRTQILSARSIARAIFLLAAFLFTLSGWVPWRVEYPPGDLDPSWILALKWAHLHSIDFGTSFAFTYGPWGFALEGYDPATFGTMVFVWSFFAAAFFFSLIVVCRAAKFPWWVSAIWITLMVTLFSSSITQDVRMFSLGWMLLLVHFTAKDRWATISKSLLAIAMALAGQLKFTMAMLAFGIFAVTTLHQILETFFIPANDRKSIRLFNACRTLLIFAAASLAFWLLAHQKISSILPYIRNSLEISGAYDRAQQAYSSDETSSVVFFLSCAIPLLALIFIAHGKRWLWAAFATAGAALCIFLIFKAGFVRHDGHELHATAGLFLLTLLWIFALWKSFHWIAKSLAVAVVVASLILCWRSFSKFGGAGLPREMARAYADFPARAGTAFSWMAGHCNMRQSYDSEMQSILTRFPQVPAVIGSVDAYPWAQDLLIARGQDFRPRPVMGSYLAYTPALEELNAAFLRSLRAPDFILFNLGTIDDRYVTQDDALSWPELFTRYEPREMSDYLLLVHSHTARQYQIVPGPPQTATFGDVLTLPTSDKLIWARIDVRPSAAGKLMETLYKARPLAIFVETADGKVQGFRLIADTARAGFLLSPSLSDPGEFAMLYTPTWQTDLQSQAVTHIRVNALGVNGPNSSYQPTFQYSFDTLDFPRGDLSKIPGFADYPGFHYLLRHAEERPGVPEPPVVRVEQHRMALLIQGATQLFVAAPIPTLAPPTSVHIGFGMTQQSYLLSLKTSGIHFIVYAMKPDNTGTAVWSQLLDPVNNPADRQHQTADIPLPLGTIGIVLGTIPLTDSPANLSYWSEVAFH
jgi:hypothetical protein